MATRCALPTLMPRRSAMWVAGMVGCSARALAGDAGRAPQLGRGGELVEHDLGGVGARDGVRAHEPADARAAPAPVGPGGGAVGECARADDRPVRAAPRDD